jgi:hypothetical protein
MAITLREGLGRKLTIAEMDENFTFLSSSYVVNSITGSMTAASSSVAARATLLSADATASFADLASDARTSNSSSVAARATLLSADATASFADLASDARTSDSSSVAARATLLSPLATASFSDYATSASYAISASHEISYETSSSLAETASFSRTGDGIFSGSFSGSYIGDGSTLTGISSYTVANSSNNRVLTSVDADNGNAEANLTFDGSTLTVAGSINETSAKRFKENIQTLGNQLNNVLQLNPVEFDWIRDGKHDIGLIAEEVNEVIPDLVQKEGKEIQGIHYSRLTAILISAVKELTARVEELENK